MTEWAKLVRVRSEEEVIEFLISQKEDALGIFPVGNGTLVEKIIPDNCKAIGLSLRCYKGIRELDQENRTVWVRAGTTIEELNKELRPKGLEVPLENAWLVERSVGGVVATNSPGRRAYLYGGVKNFLLGIRFIDTHGHVYNFGAKVLKNVTGYDVTGLMAGSWGHFAVITEVCLRTVPVAVCRRAATFRTENSSEAWELLEQLHLLKMPLAVLGWNGEEIYLEVEGNPAACAYILNAAYEVAGRAERTTEGDEETEVLWRNWLSRLPETMCIYQAAPWSFWEGRKVEQIDYAFLGTHQWGSSIDTSEARKAIEAVGGSCFPLAGPTQRFLGLKRVFDRKGILCRGSIFEGGALL